MVRLIWGVLVHKDPPHKLALGMALGIFVGLLPLMGIQMAIVTLLALPMKGNLKTAIVGVWISNPITVVPLYWGHYRFGLLFCPDRMVSWVQFRVQFATLSAWDWTAIKESVMRLLSFGADIFVPLWIGSTISAVVVGGLTYIVTYKWVVFMRLRKALRQQR